MFRTTNLPALDAEEQRAFRHDADAMGIAIKLRTEIVRAVQLLEPETLLALARQHFPDETDFQALAKFGLELSAGLRELAEHGDCARLLWKSEKERQATIVSAASRRVFEIVRKLELIAATIRSGELYAQERREALGKAGVTGDDLERLASAHETDELLAEQVALHAEQEALERFIVSRDERHLPKGFAVTPHPAPPKMERV